MLADRAKGKCSATSTAKLSNNNINPADNRMPVSPMRGTRQVLQTNDLNTADPH